MTLELRDGACELRLRQRAVARLRAAVHSFLFKLAFNSYYFFWQTIHFLFSFFVSPFLADSWGAKQYPIITGWSECIL